MQESNLLKKTNNETRKKEILIFLFYMSVVLLMYAFISHVIERKKYYEYDITENNKVIKMVEDVIVQGDELVINGWCFYLNSDCSQNKVQVFLKNINDESDIIWLNVTSHNREDIEKYYKGTGKYLHSGFTARTKIKNKEIDLEEYEIFIKLSYQDKNDNSAKNEQVVTVSTKQYLCNGILTRKNPKDNISLTETISDKFNAILYEGQMLAHNEKLDMYIYQYDNKLLWIAGNKFPFEEDGFTQIQLQFDTTREDLLPEVRLVEGWKWDDKRFNFEVYEWTENTVPYRVAEIGIPMEYPVAGVLSGYHNGKEWIWKESFNLDIRLLVQDLN